MEFPQWWLDMEPELKELLVKRFRQGPPPDCTVINGSTPVVAFGEFLTAEVATVSLNPSYREFDPKKGRFHTLSTLGVTAFDQIEEHHVVEILSKCLTYFKRGVTYRWFPPFEKFLERLVGSGFNTGLACHLDISPWATETLWGDLNPDQQGALVGTLDQQILCSLVKNFHYNRIFLNGVTTSTSILKSFFQVEYEVHSLPANKKAEVYYCCTKKLFGIELDRVIEVFGWNFYLQRSSGEHDRMNAVIDWYKQHSKFQLQD